MAKKKQFREVPADQLAVVVGGLEDEMAGLRDAIMRDGTVSGADAERTATIAVGGK